MAATTASVAEVATSPPRREKMKGAMSNFSGVARPHERWARLRFSVMGPLLAAPPERGELQGQLKNLAAKKWHHPITGQRVQFGLSTIERWFYTARNEKKHPMQALRRKIRFDHGGHPALSSKVRDAWWPSTCPPALGLEKLALCSFACAFLVPPGRRITRHMQQKSGDLLGHLWQGPM